ncbi:hypothetical protein IGI04_014563 [Brassica rapa subsp. trilocularis]|uniref:Uncharacterized protein n=1 Tax=Brassica rapa subsp. trilocularis TaxID=1813537 RepID=A0ABQ7MQ13_BRACM|nr:hypothetical protein IGI04_014563 [Brassica rapa subsp. trilocularis]
MFGLDVKGEPISRFNICCNLFHLLEASRRQRSSKDQSPFTVVTPSDISCKKFANAAVSIKFTDQTAFVEVTNTTKLILNPDGELKVPQYE